MKKFILLAMCFGVSLGGCNKVTTDQGRIDSISIEQQQAGYTKLVDLPKAYPIELAKLNGDYVDVHGQIFNEHVMEDFLEDVANEKSSFVRTVSYTIEGDPIITDVTYDGNKFYTVNDNTRDAFGIPELIEKAYKNIVTYEYSEIIYYVITNLDKMTEKDFESGFEGIILKYE